MKVLLAPNNFKGSLSAGNFCKILAKNLAQHHVVSLPVSDGGDGILDVFASAYPQSKKYTTKALDAIGRTKSAPYLILPDGKTCIVETAKICGLGVLKKHELDALGATSYGIGQVIKAAIKKGANNFYIGLGGVGCNDGGVGMAQALGFKFFDKAAKTLPKGAAALTRLYRIEKPSNLHGIKFTGLSDVTNPLLGKNGSAVVYGPQKGATKQQVVLLEAALKNYSKAVKKYLACNINRPRCGAAGAIAAGVFGLLGGQLLDGSDFILNKIKARAAVKRADIIITGEGKLDAQTFCGKAPLAVCKLAKQFKKPVIIICGINEIKNDKLLQKHNIKLVIELAQLAGGDAQLSQKNPAKYLKQITIN